MSHDTTTTAEATLATEAAPIETPTPGRVPKKAPSKKATAKQKAPAKKPTTRSKAAAKKDSSSEKTTSSGPRTVGELAPAFLEHLLAIGKSAGTARSYAADLAVARKHFTEDFPLKKLTKAKVAAYFASDAVTKTRAGEPKNAVTTAKIRRVFRLALVWAAEQGLIPEAPLPAKDAK